MPLYEHSSYDSIYYFCGNKETWNTLITQSCYRDKETYLFDSGAVPREYPKNLKVIKSKVTAKRVLRGASLENAVIFINIQNLVRDLADFPFMLGSLYSKAVIKVGEMNLIGRLCVKSLTKETKRTVKFLNKYK